MDLAMKTPKELREWRQKMQKGKPWYLVTGFDPEGFAGRPQHIKTFGHIDAMLDQKDWIGVTLRQRNIDNALLHAMYCVSEAKKLALLV